MHRGHMHATTMQMRVHRAHMHVAMTKLKFILWSSPRLTQRQAWSLTLFRRKFALPINPSPGSNNLCPTQLKEALVHCKCSVGSSGYAIREIVTLKVLPIYWHKLIFCPGNCRGMLTDGTVFDSSVERGQPFQFKLGGGQVRMCSSPRRSPSACHANAWAISSPCKCMCMVAPLPSFAASLLDAGIAQPAQGSMAILS